MTSSIDEIDRQLAEIVAEISRFLSPTFATKKLSLICKPSEEGRQYYTDSTLHSLCLECASRAMRERDAFDMTGMYLIRKEPDVPVDRMNRCTICRRWIETSRLTLLGLQICLASPDYTHYPYPYPFPLSPQLAWQFKVIAESAQHWLNALAAAPDFSGSDPTIDRIATFAQRIPRVKEHWDTQNHSGFLDFYVKGVQPVKLYVEATYAEGDQNKKPYDMDILFVNGLCNILGIDSQIWRYADHDRPHNKER
jgi:hypothetical protein